MAFLPSNTHDPSSGAWFLNSQYDMTPRVETIRTVVIRYYHNINSQNRITHNVHKVNKLCSMCIVCTVFSCIL
jgi:hypothetical protein